MDFCPIIKRRITTYEERGLTWPASINVHLNVCTWCKAWADAKSWLGARGGMLEWKAANYAQGDMVLYRNGVYKADSALTATDVAPTAASNKWTPVLLTGAVVGPMPAAATTTPGSLWWAKDDPGKPLYVLNPNHAWVEAGNTPKTP